MFVPSDIYYNIFLYLSNPIDIVRCGMTNSAAHSVFNSDYLWDAIYASRYSHSVDLKLAWNNNNNNNTSAYTNDSKLIVMLRDELDKIQLSNDREIEQVNQRVGHVNQQILQLTRMIKQCTIILSILYLGIVGYMMWNVMNLMAELILNMMAWGISICLALLIFIFKWNDKNKYASSMVRSHYTFLLSTASIFVSLTSSYMLQSLFQFRLFQAMVKLGLSAIIAAWMGYKTHGRLLRFNKRSFHKYQAQIDCLQSELRSINRAREDTRHKFERMIKVLEQRNQQSYLNCEFIRPVYSTTPSKNQCSIL